MKKLISIVLILSMLMVGCVMFSSCGAISEKDLQNDPHSALNEAWQKTVERFFEEDKEAAKILKKAADKGKYTVKLGSDDATIEMPSIEATVYTDSKAQKVVADLALDVNGTKIAAEMYANDEMLAMTAPSILGSNDAYAVYFSTLADDLNNRFSGGIGAGVDVNEEMINELVKLWNDAFAQLSSNAEQKAELKKDFKEFCDELEMSISTEDDMIVVSFVLDNETIKDALGDAAALDGLFTDSDINELLENVIFDFDADITINPKKGYIEEIVVDGDVTYTGSTVSLDASVEFSDEEIALAFKGSADGQSINANATLKKSKTDDKTSYKLVVKGGTDNVTAKLFDATYSITNDGDIKFSADIFEDENSTIKIGFKGKYKVSDDKISFSIKELSADGETVELDLSISAQAVEDIPKFPDAPKNIITMSEDEWMALVEKITSGPLGSFTGGTAEPDYGYGY